MFGMELLQRDYKGIRSESPGTLRKFYYLRYRKVTPTHKAKKSELGFPSIFEQYSLHRVVRFFYQN